jgi:basic membrane lipoprotein Med (substrate-binding protein (PBP1-ABC) superfamily)
MSADSSPIRVGLLMGVGGLGDQSFNDSAYLGLLAAQRQYDVQFSTDTWGMEPESGHAAQVGTPAPI